MTTPIERLAMAGEDVGLASDDQHAALYDLLAESASDAVEVTTNVDDVDEREEAA